MACVFCEVIAGRAHAQLVMRNEKVTAFRDLRPRAPVHVLIVPNEHIESLDTLDDERSVALAGECLRIARLVAKQEGLGRGYRLVANVGPDSGQSVFHLHFHLLGGRHMSWPPG